MIAAKASATRRAARAAAPPDWPAAARALAAGAETICGQLGPSQQHDFNALWDRLRLPRPAKAAGVPPALALPLPLLPWFCGRRLRRQGVRVPRRAVQEAALAAVLGYMAVRLHDDRLDEAAGSEATALLTGSVLLTHHLRLLASAAGARGSVEVLQQATQAWARYAEGMAVEVQATVDGATWTESIWQASLLRYAPMALPSIALCIRVGKAGEVQRSVALFSALGEAHQLFEDVVDLAEDVRGQRGGWVAELCGVRENALLGERFGYIAGIGPVLDRAHQRLDEARAIAQELGETELVGHLDARETAMRKWLLERQEAMVRALLGARRGTMSD